MLKLFRRVSDWKLFKAIEPGHWSMIRADDGEEDHVKFFGTEGDREEYISASKGHTYLLVVEVTVQE